MKNYKKILLLLLWILIIAGTTYAWKAWGWVKWIWEVDQSNRFEDHSSDNTYWTWYYLDTYTQLKWQAQTWPYWLKWASWSTDSWDDNYYANYPEPVWDWSSYTYNPPSWWVDTDYQAFKYCESLWGWNKWWRLPTKKELFSIITDINSEKNSSWKYTQLPSITQGGCWSSTASAFYSSNAWYGNFGHGYVYFFVKYYTSIYTICVHD